MSGNITLRPLENKDIPGMLEWMHDPEISCWFRFDAEEMTVETAEAFIAGSFTDENRHYAVVDSSDEYLGTISLEQIDRQNRHAMFAVSLRSCTWGTGTATSATAQLLDIAFRELGLEKVYLNVISENVRAKRFYEKAGFRYEGCFRRHLFLRGKWYDWDWYSILKEEFYAGNN